MGHGTRRRAITVLALVAAVLGGGCAPDPNDDPALATLPAPITIDPSASSVAPNGEVVVVDALDNSFRAKDITVVAGTEVEWHNVGRNDHNVLPAGDPNASAWGVHTESFPPKATYSHVFDTPGTYQYYCSIHASATSAKGMVGTITVTEP